jgi:hypothetical protein
MKKNFYLFFLLFFFQKTVLYSKTIQPVIVFADTETYKLYKKAFEHYKLVTENGTLPIYVAHLKQSDINQTFLALFNVNKDQEPFIVHNPSAFERQKKSYGFQSFTAHHEVGHYEKYLKDNHSPESYLTNCKYQEKLGTLIAPAIGTIFTYLYPAYHFYKGNNNGFKELSIGLLIGCCATYFSGKTIDAYFSWQEEHYADKRALETIECSQCCFEAAQDLNYTNSKVQLAAAYFLHYPYSFLKGDGHLPDYLRGKNCLQASLNYQKENKLCDHHSK